MNDVIALSILKICVQDSIYHAGVGLYLTVDDGERRYITDYGETLYKVLDWIREKEDQLRSK